jgi:hypothetical protein
LNHSVTIATVNKKEVYYVVVIEVIMDEREFYTERRVTKSASYVCPKCRERADYDVQWIERSKKQSLPPRASEIDRAKFAKARNHLVRVDDVVMCRNNRCRHRFDIPNFQSVVFV